MLYSNIRIDKIGRYKASKYLNVNYYNLILCFSYFIPCIIYRFNIIVQMHNKLEIMHKINIVLTFKYCWHGTFRNSYKRTNYTLVHHIISYVGFRLSLIFFNM